MHSLCTCKKLENTIALSQSKSSLKGLVGSSFSFAISALFKKADKPFLLIFSDKEEAAYYLNDLEQLLNEKDVLFYPGSYRRPYQIEETDNANVLLRAEVLNRINSRKKPALIVTYPDALFEKVLTRKELERNTLKVAVGDELTIDFVNEVLFEYQFRRVDFVTEPGEFSVRGGIVDVFSFSHDEPYRIEFFGDEIESLRSFDVETQLSTDQIKRISIIPNVENKFLDEKRESFLRYIASKTVIFSKNAHLLFSRIDLSFSKAIEAFGSLSKDMSHTSPEELFCNSELLKRQLPGFTLVEFGSASYFSDVTTREKEQDNDGDLPVKFNTTPQPSFNKKFDLLIDDLLPMTSLRSVIPESPLNNVCRYCSKIR